MSELKSRTLNYVYHCSPPSGMREYIDAQTRLYVKFYNKRIENARRFFVARDDLRCRMSTDYAKLKAEEDRLNAELEGVFANVRKRNCRFRELLAGDDDRQAVNRLRSELKVVYEEKRSALEELWKSSRYKELEKSIRQRVQYSRDKLAYTVFGSQGELYSKLHCNSLAAMSKQECEDLAKEFASIAKSRANPPLPDDEWFTQISIAFSAAANGRPLTAGQFEAIEELRDFLRIGDREPHASDYGELWWCTRSHACQASESAVDRSDKNGDLPRFKSAVDMAPLACVQIQGGISEAEFYSGRETYIRAEVVGTRGKNKLVRVQLRIGSDGRKPVFMETIATIHRDWPKNAVLKWATVQCEYGPLRRHNVDGQLVIKPTERWSLMLTLSTTESIARAETGTVAVHLGWKKVGKEMVRVATWHGENPALAFERPKSLASGYDIVCVESDGKTETGEIILGDEPVSSIPCSDKTRSVRDRLFNEIKGSIIELRRDNRQIPDWFLSATDGIHHWRDKKRLLRVLTETSSRLGGARDRVLSSWESITGDRETLANLYTWSDRELSYNEFELCQRASLSRRRKELFRRFAAMLRKRYAHVIISGDDIAAKNRKRSDVDEAERGERAYQRLVSHGDLRSCVINSHSCVTKVATAKSKKKAKANGHVKPATIACPSCHHHQAVGRELLHTCTGCGATWDRLHAAARTLLASGCAIDKTADPLAPENKGNSGDQDTKVSRWAVRKATRSQEGVQVH